MDTPEKKNFLGSVRELRTEAEDKLKENRYYLAIQKLDEITEAVEKSNMSPEEIETVSHILRGESEAMSASDDTIKGFNIPEVSVENADVDAASASEQQVPQGSGDVEVITADEAAAPAAASDTSQVDQAETSEGQSTSSEYILPNWWKTDRQAITIASAAPAVVEEKVVEETATTISNENILPNWWRTDRQSEVSPTTVAEEKVVEEAGMKVADGEQDSSVATASAAVAAVAAGTMATNLMPETVEIAEAREEVQITETPDAGIETGGQELSEVSLDSVEMEIDAIEKAALDIPEVKIPEVEAPVVETEEEPTASDTVEIIPDVAEVDTVPEIEIEADETPEIDLEALGLEVSKEDVVEAAVVQDMLVVDEVAASEAVTKETDMSVAAGVAAGVAVAAAVSGADSDEAAAPEVVVEEVAASEVVVEETDMSAAVIAAGAAAAVAAVTVSGTDSDEMATVEEVVVEESPEPTPEPAEVQQTPEKPAASSAPVEEKIADAPPPPAGKILGGDDLKRHPSYGGNRGGFLKRFVNSLKGKDYI
jgi:hypothetical protein